eukprot:Opistho-2@69655
MASADAADAAPSYRFAFTKLAYPGPFEFLHKECKDVFTLPYLIDGAKLVVNKPVNNNFQVSHTIALGGAVAPPSYHFGATYVGTKRSGPGEQYPIILGDVDTDDNLIAQAIHELAPGLKGKFQAQTQGPNWGVQWEADYKGGDFHASVKAINPNLIDNNGIVIANYLQSVTENVSVGGEFMLQYNGPMRESGFFCGIALPWQGLCGNRQRKPRGRCSGYICPQGEREGVGRRRTRVQLAVDGVDCDCRIPL